MANNALHKVIEQAKETRRKNRWNKVVTGMAAFVVFCTTYALILPAITEERQPLCGLEEHVHTDKCWEKPKALTCPYQKAAEDGTLTLLVHTHDENCYDIQGNLVCALPEVESHVHDYRCYTDVPAEAPHVHTDACYEEVKTLICELPESDGHAHGETCYDENGELTCELPESEGHTHTDACYAPEKTLICGKTEATEEELAASAGEPEKLLTCGRDEVILHQHTEECRDTYGNLTCELNELFAHQHGKECWTPIRDAEKILACGLEEHTHDDTCYTDLEADLETPEMWEALLPELTGSWADDLLAVAQTQLGYEQSKDNVTVTPEGLVLSYTRYGQWAGAPYGPWSLNFLDFCHHYAGIPGDAFPVHSGQLRWCEQLKEENWNIYFAPDQYTPVPGDTVFLDLDVDGAMDAAAIVWACQEETEEAEASLTVIQGDADGSVQKCSYLPSDPVILGYASLSAAETRWAVLNPPPAPEPTRYCGLDAHTHTAECYDEENNLICALPEHTHTEACLTAPVIYYCGLEEHAHDENCYDNQGSLICHQEEHTHEALCRVEQKYFCGLEEHTHTDECYGEDNVLICGKEAHTHTEDCVLSDQTLEAEISEDFGVWEKNEITVSGLMPLHAKVQATPVQLGEEYGDVVCAYNFAVYDGKENSFQPVIPLDVTISIPGMEAQKDAEFAVINVLDDEMGIAPQSDDEVDLAAQQPSPAPTTAVPYTMPNPGQFNFPVAALGETYALTVTSPGVDCPEDCKFNSFLGQWEPTSNDHPFGSAQDFNVFLLGDLGDWGAIHGNAAIGGNILAPTCNSGIGYFEGSAYDYAADLTAPNDIALLLGGEIKSPLTIQVSNGTVIKKNSVPDEKIGMDTRGNPANHIHNVDATAEPDPFKYFFEEKAYAAADDNNPSGSLKQHNADIYEYSTSDRVTDGHLGSYHVITEDEAEGYPIGEGAAPVAGYIHLKGGNQFYNVFNLPATLATTLGGTQFRVVYLDIPADSYAIINIDGQEMTVYHDDETKDDAFAFQEKMTQCNDFCLQLWYRDSNSKWQKQPAVQNAEVGYNQSQMVLVNFDPDITAVNFPLGNDYLYASILGPNVNLDSMGVNLHGTIVLNSMKGTLQSHALTNPFLVGSSVTLTKETVCDCHEESHRPDCPIYTSGINDLNENGQVMEDGNWADYFAEVKFRIVTDPEKPEGVPAIKKRLPLSGKSWNIDGLSPGTYQVDAEVVYKQVTLEDGSMVMVTVDENGYWMRLRFGSWQAVPGGWEWKSDPNAKNWTLTYCKGPDNNFEVLGSGQVTDGKGEYDYPSLWANSLEHLGGAKANPDEFIPLNHRWNFANFKMNGQESPLLIVQPGADHANLKLVNHYDLTAKGTRSVIKKWYERHPDANGDGKPEYVAVEAPVNTTVKVQLWRMKEGDLNSREIVPDTEELLLNKDNSWFGAWSGLDLNYLENSQTKPYKFFIKETTDVAGFTAEYYFIDKDGKIDHPDKDLYNEVTGLFTVRNWREAIPLGSLKVLKLWYDDHGDLIDATDEAHLKDLKTAVQLYRQFGRVTEDAEDLANRSNLKFYLDEVADLNLCGEETPYFDGSDVRVYTTFYMFAADQNLENGTGGAITTFQTAAGLGPEMLTYHGKKLKDAHFVSSKAQQRNNGCFIYQVTIDGMVENLSGDSSFVLKYAKPATYSGEIELLKTETVFEPEGPSDYNPEGYTAPAPVFWHEEERIPDYWIDWNYDEDGIEKVVSYTYEDEAGVEQTELGYQELTFDTQGKNPGFSHIWQDLPLGSTVELNDAKIHFRYRYYVLEEPIPEGYKVTYNYGQVGKVFDEITIDQIQQANAANEDNEPYPGVTGEFITVQNRPQPKGGPELPMTGGTGTLPYTLGGLFSVLLAGFLMQYNHKRRKEDFPL